MALPMVKEFLCGMTVRTGGLIIGWLCLIYSTFILVSVISYSIEFYEMSESNQEEVLDWIVNQSSNHDERLSTEHLSKEDYEKVIYVIKLIFCFIGIMAIAKCIIDIFLVVGVHKKNPYMMLPWIIVQGIGCVLLMFGLLLWCFSLLFLFMADPVVPVFKAFTVTAGMMLNITVSGYCFLVIHTYYRTIKNRKKEAVMNYVKM